MMVMQQIAPGADFLSILRPYFGQTKQHMLFTREVDAELALPKNVPNYYSFKYVPNEWPKSVHDD